MAIEATSAAPGKVLADDRPTREARLTLVVASAATLLVLVNYTSPMTILSSIGVSLHASVSGETWMLSSISLGLSALLLVAGSLADDYGRKRVFVIGTAVMVVATLGCALATSTWFFVVSRIVQGAASASLTVASLGLIGHTFPAGAARTRATGIWGAMVGLGIAIGPVLSAAIIRVADWRVVYWALGAAAFAVLLAALRLPESRSAVPRAIDYAGLLSFGAAITCLVAALIQGRQGWGRADVLSMFVASAVLLAIFVAAEARSREPMLELGLFRRPAFVAATVGALFTGLAIIGLMSYVPTVAQRSLHLSPLAAGGLLGIWSGVSFVVALQARRLAPYLDTRHQLASGMLLCALGEAGMLGLTEHTSWLRLTPGLIVAGIGSGLLNAALARLAVSSVPPGRGGTGSGANNTARYVGSSIGVAVVVAVISTAAHTGTAAHVLARGANAAIAVSAGMALVGALVVLLCRERPEPVHASVDAPVAEAPVAS